MRVLDENDFTDSLRIFTEVFEEDELDNFLDSWAGRNKSASYGIFSFGKMEAFIIIRDDLSSQPSVRNNHIEYIGVDPKSQGKGLGKLLLQTAIDIFTEVGTDITLIPINDDKIIHWYMRNGFEIESVTYRQLKGKREIFMRRKHRSIPFCKENQMVKENQNELIMCPG